MASIRRAIALLLISQAAVSSVLSEFYSYSYSSKTVDDGDNSFTQVSRSNYDSNLHRQPQVEQEISFSTKDPSSGSSFEQPSQYDYFRKRQLATNQIGVGIKPKRPRYTFNQFMGHLRDAWSRGRSLQPRPRSVQPPALATDTGGQQSNVLAGELAKVFNVQQGHYANIYNQLDGLTRSTRKPADVIEETVRNTVSQMFQQ